MTRYADPAVLSCPNCEAPVLQRRMASLNFIGIDRWSDGHVGHWGTGGTGELCRCPMCSKMFWIADAPRLGVMPRESRIRHWSKTRRVLAHIIGQWKDDFARDAAWCAVPSSWHCALRIESPDGPNLLSALKDGMASTVQREQYLRTNLWWAGNHPLRRYKLESPMSEEEERDNKVRLLELLQSAPDVSSRPMVRVELLRELGQFDAAIELLESLAPGNDEMVPLQLVRATARDALVFKIESKDPMG